MDSQVYRIAEACLPKGANLKQVTRSGEKVWAVVKGKVDLMVKHSLSALADAMEEEVRKEPLVCTHEATHVFGKPCVVKFGPKRGEFILEGVVNVHLEWHGPGTRWVGYTECGQRLKYGPSRDFKLSFTEQDRQQPALKAWLAY